MRGRYVSSMSRGKKEKGVMRGEGFCGGCPPSHMIISKQSFGDIGGKGDWKLKLLSDEGLLVCEGVYVKNRERESVCAFKMLKKGEREGEGE